MRQNNQKELLPVVRDHLYAQDLAARKRSAGAISKTSSREIASQLLGLLDHPNRYIAIRAAFGLSLMKPSLVVPCLARAMDSHDVSVINHAAWALGRIRSPRAREALIAALTHSNNRTRSEAASGLWQHAVRGFKSKEVERKLTAMLDGDRGHVALTLKRMRAPKRAIKAPRPRATAFDLMGGDFIK